MLVSTSEPKTRADINANGSSANQPANEFSTVLERSLTRQDGSATSGVATVTIPIQTINDAPVALDTLTEAEEHLLVIPVQAW